MSELGPAAFYAELQERRMAALITDAESLTQGGAMHPDINTAGVMQVMEERQSIIKEFEWAITDRQKTVEELHVRLVPVTRSESTVDKLSDPLPPTSEARSRLHDLQGTTASLRGLLNRLEV